MANLTYVPKGKSSTQAESSELDYRRGQDGEGDEANLESIKLEARGGGWELTVTHDRNGRKERQAHHFGSYREAWEACEPDDGQGEKEEPIRQKGGAQAGRGGY